MVFIEAGCFQRGSTLFLNEGPVKEVNLSSFWIDRFPVTNERFSKFIQDGGYQRRDLWTEAGWMFIASLSQKLPLYWCNERWNQPRQPVTGISWWEALAFAKSEGKMLPTETQWEYAAGAGRNLYPWGSTSPTVDLANFAPGCEPPELNRRSTLVDQHPLAASPFGCHDMAGNLNEWCLDNSSNDYLWDRDCVNPCYIMDEFHPHIVRGGSGLHDEDCLRCASRDYYPPEMRDNIVGIRCVINVGDVDE